MTLVDTNLLVYATFADAPEHDRAREWLETRLAEPDETVAFCWPVVYAFLRLLTSARVFGEHAVTVREAWAVVAAYLDQPGVRLIQAGEGHKAIAAELAETPGLRSDDVPDIEIAALAIEHGLVLATHDHGFRRFSRLRVADPLTTGETQAKAGGHDGTVSDAERLPAEELIRAGLRDLEHGVESAEALLVSIGAPRLARAGFPVRAPLPAPEQTLYRLLSVQYGDAAHSRYNALIRRLVSFERAASAAGRPRA